jgi:hypothetical protein
MTYLVDAKVLVGWLGQAIAWFQERRDPIRAQAARVLHVFEAHGVARTQICRMLPEQFAIPIADFASPEKLKAHLTPALLDWIAEAFALNRAWLGGVESQPHRKVGSYKYPREFLLWLQERRRASDAWIGLTALKATDEQVGPGSEGDVVLVVSEEFAELDDEPISRYFFVDGSGPLDHYPVLRNMMGVFKCADRTRCVARGVVVPEKTCKALMDGTMLIPEAFRLVRGLWEPDWPLFPMANGKSEWVAQIRAEVAEDLAASDAAQFQS